MIQLHSNSRFHQNDRDICFSFRYSFHHANQTTEKEFTTRQFRRTIIHERRENYFFIVYSKCINIHTLASIGSSVDSDEEANLHMVEIDHYWMIHRNFDKQIADRSR